MTTQYEGLWSGVQSLFDDMFGATFSFTPMREVRNATAVPDTTRSAIASVVGIPVIDGGQITAGAQLVTRSGLSQARFSFLETAFPEGIQRADILQRTNGPTPVMGRRFEVASVMPDPEAIYRLRVEIKEIPPELGV